MPQDPMLEVFIYENQQLLDTLESILLAGERDNTLDSEHINEIFRIMHTIKGSASMMSFDNLAKLTHAVEDMFSQIRDKHPQIDDWSQVIDIVLSAVDIITADMALISSGQQPQGDSSAVVQRIKDFMPTLSKENTSTNSNTQSQSKLLQGTVDDYVNASYYKIVIHFEPEAQMENMRAFGVVTALEPMCYKISHSPEDLMNSQSSEEIINNGFTIYVLTPQNPDDIEKMINDTMFLEKFNIIPLSDHDETIPKSIQYSKLDSDCKTSGNTTAMSNEVITKQNFISVNVNKLDQLMDLIGEVVTSESMVTNNPEVQSLQIESFERASQLLHKQIKDLQDTIMSIRMVPVSYTFHRMERIVRDISRASNKKTQLEIVGEETEVDKNILDSLADPLMHLIRNAVDHGIEPPEERKKKGKSEIGTVTLEARNTGGDVVIIVKDDGKGLDSKRIIEKAIDKELTQKAPSEISDKEAYNMIFLPGFSTTTEVTEFSGRGVGMDVVRRNIEKISGRIHVDSTLDKGMTVQIRIPLTLAIIDGMQFRVGNLHFIIPMLSISESFKPNLEDVFLDPDGKEMIMVRGECFPILRLHNVYDITSEFNELDKGILIMIRGDNQSYCLFVDQLIGEQQAVIKPLPLYIQRHNSGLHGISGCSILGDGSICLIIDANTLV